MRKVFSLVLMLLLVASAVFAGGRQGGTYPTRPITVIVPFAPGGGSDTLVRNVMRFIDMPWAAVNIDGAGGLVGAMQAFNSAPNGYTIFTHNTLDFVGYYASGVDTIPLISEVTTIALLVTDYNVISTNRIASAEFGWRTMDDVVAWLRANPTARLRWGVSGAALGDNMISSIRVARALGIYDNFIFVSYDSGASVRTASLQNEIHISMNTASELPGVVASGDNIPLLVVNDTRIASLPNTPSTLERGIDVTMTKPRGFFGPRGMNPEHVRAIESALREVSRNPEFQTAMAALGFDVAFVEGARASQMARYWLEEMRPFFEEMRGR